MSASEKDSMRALILRGGPWTDVERGAILDYCQADVLALERLFWKMLPSLDLPRAIFRGRYSAAVARMEWTGVPIDVGALATLRERWDDIKDRLIAEVDRDFGVLRVPASEPTGLHDS